MENKKQCENRDNIIHFFCMLNDAGIKYTIIKNIGNEIPDNLEVGKDIDILVDIGQKEKFNSEMKKVARKIHHPYNLQTGWENLYGLPEFEFWRLFKGQELVIDVTYMLCCKSITPRKWLPLDRKIQEYVWDNVWFDPKNNWWITDVNTQYLYCVIRSVFDKRLFSKKYISELEKLKNDVDWEMVSELFKTVFFEFTNKLVSLLKSGGYSSIIKEYTRYEDY